MLKVIMVLKNKKSGKQFGIGVSFKSFEDEEKFIKEDLKEFIVVDHIITP